MILLAVRWVCLLLHGAISKDNKILMFRSRGNETCWVHPWQAARSFEPLCDSRGLPLRVDVYTLSRESSTCQNGGGWGWWHRCRGAERLVMRIQTALCPLYIQQLIFLRLASMVLVCGPVNQESIFAHMWSVSGIICATARPLLATVSWAS